jgi:hypothetical protein
MDVRIDLGFKRIQGLFNVREWFRKIPVVVGRSLGSANCESSFSDVKNCIEQKGRGKKSISKPEQVSRGLKKWWLKQTLKTTIANSTDKNNFYSKLFHFKDIPSTKDWCGPAKSKEVSRREPKETFSNSSRRPIGIFRCKIYSSRQFQN